MKRYPPTITSLALSLLVTLCLPPALVQAKKPAGGGGGPGYSLVVLAPPEVDLVASYAHDLNEGGNVVGCYENSAGEYISFCYSAAQNSYQIFASGVRVFGLNNLGEMVGSDEVTGEGLYWRSPDDQNPIALDPLPGHTISFASRINDAGVIVGQSRGDGFSLAVAWKVNAAGTVSSPVLLPFAIGDVRGSATDLTELDQDGMCRVVGYSGTDNPYETALQWDLAADGNGLLMLATGPIDVGSLGGEPSAAFAVNFAGDIVGKSGAWPFLKFSGQPAQALPGIRKATWGYAEGINDGGTMVGMMGYLAKGFPIQRAVLWTDAATIVDLNKKVALGRSDQLEAAFRISDAGLILAVGFFPETSQAGDIACLLVPN